eukprot:m.318853 g.318853  ORF g.318853 m.318853 type:complete len:719 (+) comp20291_c0_seq10:218-2374(+)
MPKTVYNSGAGFLTGAADFSNSDLKPSGGSSDQKSGNPAAMTDNSSNVRRSRTESRIAIILAIAALCTAMAALVVSLTRPDNCSCVSEATNAASGSITSGSESTEQAPAPPGPPGARGEMGSSGPAGAQGPIGFPGGDGVLAAAFAARGPNCNATGDGVADDTAALQACIDAAGETASAVILPAGVYLTTDTLHVPGGVRIQGEGIGNNPLSITRPTGSMIKYRGTGVTMNITGHAASLVRVTLFDELHTASVGVLVHANGVGIESLVLHEVLFYYYTGGTALHMHATNGGGVAYCSFYDLRFRHASSAIVLESDGINFSFVNSNTFYGGAISGGGYAYGIHIRGPGSVNNNVFMNIVVEMYASTHGHLVVEGESSWVEVYGSRFEAKDQTESVPIVSFHDNTSMNVFEAMVGHSWVKVNTHANPRVRVATGKTIAPAGVSRNELLNPTFAINTNQGNFDADGRSIGDVASELSYWQTTCASVHQFVAEADMLYAGNTVLQVTVPAQSTCDLTPLGYVPPSPTARHIAFGAHIQADDTDASAYAGMRGHSEAIQGSSPQSGFPAMSWSFVGLEVRYEGQLLSPKLYFENQRLSGAVVINVTAPLLSYAGLVPVAGLPGEQGVSNVASFNTSLAAFTGYLQLSRFVSVVRLSGTGTVSRINWSLERYVRGSVLTLINDGAVGFASSVYVSLAGAWSAGAGHSLGLLSNGDGTWTEIYRS